MEIVVHKEYTDNQGRTAVIESITSTSLGKAVSAAVYKGNERVGVYKGRIKEFARNWHE